MNKINNCIKYIKMFLLLNNIIYRTIYIIQITYNFISNLYPNFANFKLLFF